MILRATVAGVGSGSWSAAPSHRDFVFRFRPVEARPYRCGPLFRIDVLNRLVDKPGVLVQKFSVGPLDGLPPPRIARGRIALVWRGAASWSRRYCSCGEIRSLEIWGRGGIHFPLLTQTRSIDSLLASMLDCSPPMRAASHLFFHPVFTKHPGCQAVAKAEECARHTPALLVVRSKKNSHSQGATNLWILVAIS